MPAANQAVQFWHKPYLATPVAIGSNSVASGAGATSVTITTSAAVPPGCAVFVSVVGHKSSSLSVSTVNDGSSYSLAKSSVWSATTFAVTELWMRLNSPGLAAGSSITVTMSAASDAGDLIAHAFYVQGIAASSASDQSASAIVNSTTSCASGATSTLGQSWEIAIGVVGGYSAGAAVTYTDAGSFAQISHTNSNTRYNIHSTFLIVSATTALNYQTTASASVLANILICTFKAA